MFLERPLERVQQTTDQLVLRERPLFFTNILQLVICLLPFFVWMEVDDADIHKMGVQGFLIASFASATLLALALIYSIESTFCIDRPSGTLRITRQLFRWRSGRDFSVTDVLRIYEDRTLKGNRLMMQLSSSPAESFTRYLASGSREAEAAMVNQYLNWVKESGAQASGGNPAVH